MSRAAGRQAPRYCTLVHMAAVFLLWLLLSHPTPPAFRPPIPSPPHTHTTPQVAEEYLDVPEFYYPHTLDFRGRAYPLHPNMHHLGEQQRLAGWLAVRHTHTLRPAGTRAADCIPPPGGSFLLSIQLSAVNTCGVTAQRHTHANTLWLAVPVPVFAVSAGDDTCRGLLMFAHGRPLGPEGLGWLQVHLANVWGNGQDKLSFEDRR